jgi:hypothetical protein
MSQFAILIYEDEAGWMAGGPEAEAAHKAHMTFNERHRPTGVVTSGEALQPTVTGSRTIRQDGTVTDGAFLETKEVLGGYYVVEARDLDEAIEIAKDVPHPFGALEVRPVMVFE